MTTILYTFPSIRRAREEFRKNYVVDLLTFVGGNVSAASKVSGLHRTCIYKILAKENIDPKVFRKKYKEEGNGSKQTSACVERS